MSVPAWLTILLLPPVRTGPAGGELWFDLVRVPRVMSVLPRLGSGGGMGGQSIGPAVLVFGLAPGKSSPLERSRCARPTGFFSRENTRRICLSSGPMNSTRTGRKAVHVSGLEWHPRPGSSRLTSCRVCRPASGPRPLVHECPAGAPAAGSSQPDRGALYRAPTTASNHPTRCLRTVGTQCLGRRARPRPSSNYADDADRFRSADRLADLPPATERPPSSIMVEEPDGLERWSHGLAGDWPRIRPAGVINVAAPLWEAGGS